MTSVLYLAYRYLVYHWVKSLLLIGSVGVIVSIPAQLVVLASQGEAHLRSRAATTPLLIGSKGSPLELVLNSLYFRSKVPAALKYEEVERVAESRLTLPIPLYTRFRAQDDPIVGTTIDYFRFRGLRITSGRQMTRLGDCVVGAAVARRRGLRPGASVVSTPAQAFDVAGVAPLKMHVSGLLAPADSPDDDVVFVDLKTTWLIEGIGHGHQDLATPAASAVVSTRDAGHVTAKAGVPQYTEVTDETLDSFHFHGEPKTFPITAILAIPESEKAATRLLGRYQPREQPDQAVEPTKVMDELLTTVVTLRTFALAACALVSLVTLVLVALIEALSLRLRQRELETLARMGGSRGRIVAMLITEALAVFVAALVLAAGLTALTASWGTAIVRWWIVS